MHQQDDFSTTSEVSRRQKYRGLLKRRVAKNFRDDCFRFFDYVYTMAPAHETVVHLMRIVHHIQFFLMSLCPLSQTLWPINSLLGKICNVVAVVANLCTPQASEIAHIAISFTVYAFLIAFIILLYCNLKLFQKYTKINPLIINLICIVLNAFLPYFVLFIGFNIGRNICVIVLTSNYLVLEIVCILIGAILAIVLILLQVYFVTPSLTFRPQTIHLLNARSIICYFGSAFIISVLSALGGGLNNFILLFITIVPLLLLHFLFYFRLDSWGNNEYRGRSLSVIECVTFMLLSESFLFLFDIPMNEIILFIVMAIYIGLRLSNNFFHLRAQNQYITLCDRLFEQQELFEQLTENQAIQVLRIGFEFGHKLCHSWRAFELADRKFPKSRRILFLFMRYAAIYPDESAIFRMATRQVQSMKKHSMEMKFLLFQINSLHQQRERGLSKSLKKTLSHITDKTEKCRSQMRFIWESVIRGNISDLENLSMQLKKNEEDIQREYNQLCLVYPNNPYVASAFAAFLSDIVCKEKEASEFATIYRLLRNGARTRIERTYFFALRHLKQLPTEQQHTQLCENRIVTTKNDNQSIASLAVGNVGDMNDPTEDKSQQKYIEAMIDSVHLPSMRYGPFLIFASISLVFPLISIPFSLFVLNNMDFNARGIQLMKVCSLQQTAVSHVALAFTHYIFFKNRFLNSLTEILKLPSTVTPLIHLLELTQTNEDYLNDINEIFPGLLNTGYFSKSLEFLFKESLTFPKVYSNNSLGTYQSSYQYYISRVGESTLRAAPLRPTKLLNLLDFWTLSYSFTSFLSQSIKFSRIQMEEMRNMMQGNYERTLLIVFATGFISLTLFLGITTFVFMKMHKEKGALFRCFKSLPKSAISAIVARLNAQSGKHDEEDNHKSLTTQEEHALRVLTMAQNQFVVNYSYFPVFIILAIFLISVICVFIFLVQSQNYINENFPKMYSMMYSAAELHSTFIAVILNEFKIVAHGQRQTELSSLVSKEDLLEETGKLLENLTYYTHSFRFGNDAMNSTGLSGIDSNFITRFTKSPTISVGTPNTDEDILTRLSLENSMTFVQLLLNNLYNNLVYYDTSVSMNHYTFDLSILWLLNTSYEQIVHGAIDSAVESSMKLQEYVELTYITIPVIIFDAVIFICGILLIPRFMRSGEVAQWAMRLLLFCPPGTVLQSRPIIKILSNDFTTDDNDENEETSAFYENIVSHIPDAAVFLDNELIIHSVNPAFEKMFNNVNKLNVSLFELFNSPKGKEASLFSFISALKNIIASRIAPSFEGDIDVLISNKNTPILNNLSLVSKISNEDEDKENYNEDDEENSVFNLSDNNNDNLNNMNNDNDINMNNNMNNNNMNNNNMNKTNEINNNNDKNNDNNKKKEKKVGKNKYISIDNNNNNNNNNINDINNNIEIYKKDEVDYNDEKDEELLLHLSLTSININGEVQKKPIPPDGISIFSLQMTNITKRVEYQTKISEEKEKSTHLLSLVLPPPVVTRLMSGDSNIHFKVQSASFVFIDIVKFSKWSSSVAPTMVMSTLNSLIEQFDRILSNYSEMTKIKSLGDNYLAAGGIFDEVNQPQVHAKQAISFGLDAISALDLVNVQTQLSLRIRVGLNTGGPVVAGLLNLNKPSFEVLGGPIGLASELEKTGTPMNVHIPHHVYELVYGNQFLIKEANELEFKYQQVTTYLVSGYDRQI